MVAAGSGGSFIQTGFGFLTEPNHNLDEGRSISGAQSSSRGARQHSFCHNWLFGNQHSYDANPEHFANLLHLICLNPTVST